MKRRAYASAQWRDYRRAQRYGIHQVDPYERGRRAGYIGLEREILDFPRPGDWTRWFQGWKAGRAEFERDRKRAKEKDLHEPQENP